MLWALVATLSVVPTQGVGGDVVWESAHKPPEPCKNTPLIWRLLDPDDSPILDALGFIIASPFIIPYRAAEADPPRPFIYELYPYADASPGLLRFEPEETPTLFPTFIEPTPEELVAWQTGGTRTGYHVTADVAHVGRDQWRIRTRLRILTPTRAEIDLESAEYGLRDNRHLVTSVAHIDYRFAQATSVLFRVGIGPRIHVDHRATYGGFDLTYGFDAFIAKPLVLSASAALGMAGKHFVTDLRASFGVIFSTAEIMFGYEQLVVSGTSYPGPTLGVRLWL